MTNFLQVRHVIAVRNLEASSVFYREVLGFEIKLTVDATWRIFTRKNCEILAGEWPSVSEPADHAYFAYWVVDDVRSLYQHVLQQIEKYPAEVFKSKVAQPKIFKTLTREAWGMWEFGLTTPDAHQIMIGQDLD